MVRCSRRETCSPSSSMIARGSGDHHAIGSSSHIGQGKMPCAYASSSHSGESRPPMHNKPSGVVDVGGGKNRDGGRPMSAGIGRASASSGTNSSSKGFGSRAILRAYRARRIRSERRGYGLGGNPRGVLAINCHRTACTQSSHCRFSMLPSIVLHSISRSRPLFARSPKLTRQVYFGCTQVASIFDVDERPLDSRSIAAIR